MWIAKLQAIGFKTEFQTVSRHAHCPNHYRRTPQSNAVMNLATDHKLKSTRLRYNSHCTECIAYCIRGLNFVNY